jgi:hypothetical protein
LALVFVLPISIGEQKDEIIISIALHCWKSILENVVNIFLFYSIILVLHIL